MHKEKSEHTVTVLYLTVFLTMVNFLTLSCKSASVKDSMPLTSSDEDKSVKASTSVVIDNNYHEIIESVKVENGAVIIDGRYIEAPYMIEGRENGIWINGVLAEKRTPRREKYREAREIAMRQAIEDEVLADYFESVEEVGKERAGEKVKERILNKGNIRGVKIKRIELKTPPEYIEVETVQDGDFNIRISTLPKQEKYMLERAINRKYRTWYKARSVEKEKEAYKDLINFLDEQKQKGRIEEYQFEKSYDKDRLAIKYKNELVWNMLWASSVSTPEDITTIKYPSDEEADKLDKEDLQSYIEILKETLSSGYLEVFRKSAHAYGAPGGRSTILGLKKIMSDKTLTLEERKKKVKEVYLPAQIEEEFLQQLLDNWER